jgi:signal transduction histidine kinase
LLYGCTGSDPCIAGTHADAIDPARLPIRDVLESGRPRQVNGPPPIETAWLVPLRRPGSGTPYGVLAAGTSPRLPFDDEYRDFITLAADHIAICISSTRARNDLEQRVAERTIELQASNRQLAEALRERMALETARSEWLRKLIAAQEDERRRVARELHDEMGQHLSALSAGLDELRSAAPLRAAWLRQQVEEIERGVRRLARDLRPAALDDLGLVTALSTYVDEWSKQHGVAADFCSRHCGQRLPSIVESTIYRIVQEALTNVARHAHAQNVGVVLECAGPHVTVIVEDDGRGFDPAAAAAAAGTTHFGLRGIRERAALLGGTLTIESAGGATTVFVSLPLAVGAAAAYAEEVP